MIALFLMSLIACNETEYEDGWTDGCEAGGHYGREQGIRAAGFDTCEDPLTSIPSVWPAYLLADDSYEAGRDDGYDACFQEAAMCAWSETCMGEGSVDPYSDTCRSYWATDTADRGGKS